MKDYRFLDTIKANTVGTKAFQSGGMLYILHVTELNIFFLSKSEAWEYIQKEQI